MLPMFSILCICATFRIFILICFTLILSKLMIFLMLTFSSIFFSNVFKQKYCHNVKCANLFSALPQQETWPHPGQICKLNLQTFFVITAEYVLTNLTHLSGSLSQTEAWWVWRRRFLWIMESVQLKDANSWWIIVTWPFDPSKAKTHWSFFLFLSRFKLKSQHMKCGKEVIEGFQGNVVFPVTWVHDTNFPLSASQKYQKTFCSYS